MSQSANIATFFNRCVVFENSYIYCFKLILIIFMGVLQHLIRLSQFLFPRNSVKGDIVTRPFVGGCVGTIATTVLPNHFHTSHVSCG